MRVGVMLGLVDAEAAGVFAVVLDALEELGDEFFAHAGELGELAGFGGGFEGVDVADLAGGPDEGDGLGAHAGEAEELEHGGLVFLQELFAEGQGAGGDESDWMLAAMPLPMPGMARSCLGSSARVASWVVCCSTASAARR